MTNLRKHFTPTFLDKSPVSELEAVLQRREVYSRERAQLDKELQKHIIQRKMDEYVVSSPEEIAMAVYGIVTAMDEVEPNVEYGCSHHGFYIEGLEGISVAVLDRMEGTLITMYLKDPFSERYMTKESHHQRRDAITEVFGVKLKAEWNGGGRQNGISIVLDRPAPPSLLSAMKAGRALDGEEMYRTAVQEMAMSNAVAHKGVELGSMDNPEQFGVKQSPQEVNKTLENAYVPVTAPGEERIYNVWAEGYLVSGMEGVPSGPSFLGSVMAKSFEESVQKLSDIKDEDGAGRNDYDVKRLTYWGCKLFESESEARVSGDKFLKR